MRPLPPRCAQPLYLCTQKAASRGKPHKKGPGRPRQQGSQSPPRKASKASHKKALKPTASRRKREQDTAHDRPDASATAPSALGPSVPRTKRKLVPPEVPPTSPLSALPCGEAVTVVYHRGWFQAHRFDKNTDKCSKLVEELEEEMTTFAAVCGRQVVCQFAYNQEWRDKLQAYLSASGLIGPAESCSPDSDGEQACSRPVLRKHVQAKRHKKAIAYSLFGGLHGGIGWNSTVHPAMEYVVGAWENCVKAQQYYPDWVVRIYYDQSMPAAVLSRLANYVFVRQKSCCPDSEGQTTHQMMSILG